MLKLVNMAAVVMLLLLADSADAAGQSANYRAQARYYTAKEAYDAKQFDAASRALLESRQLLQGKSNERLQYLLVMSLYHAGRYTAAQKEMARFFDLQEQREKPEYYTKDVDRLTSDEVRQITMILDRIDANVANNTEAKVQAAKVAADEAAREAAERQRVAAARQRVYAALSGTWAAGRSELYTHVSDQGTTGWFRNDHYGGRFHEPMYGRMLNDQTISIYGGDKQWPRRPCDLCYGGTNTKFELTVSSDGQSLSGLIWWDKRDKAQRVTFMRVR